MGSNELFGIVLQFTQYPVLMASRVIRCKMKLNCGELCLRDDLVHTVSMHGARDVSGANVFLEVFGLGGWMMV